MASVRGPSLRRVTIDLRFLDRNDRFLFGGEDLEYGFEIDDSESIENLILNSR